ncbi:MAG: hypothetical protein R3C26_12985 [Calditrichia bacterium]
MVLLSKSVARRRNDFINKDELSAAVLAKTLNHVLHRRKPDLH